MAAKFTIDGVPEFRRALDRAGDLAVDALKSAMFEEQSAVISDAQRITPVDTGVLRASGTVLPPEVKGTRVEVVAGFGGAAKEYAIPVHERLGAHHPVGQAKFLESAFLSRAGKIPRNLAKRIERAWRRLAV